MLCIWWDIKGVVYYKVLNDNEIINFDILPSTESTTSIFVEKFSFMYQLGREVTLAWQYKTTHYKTWKKRMACFRSKYWDLNCFFLPYWPCSIRLSFYIFLYDIAQGQFYKIVDPNRINLIKLEKGKTGCVCLHKYPNKFC